jgi:uncharacterized protein YutD
MFFSEIQINENRIHLVESVKEGYDTKCFASAMMMMVILIIQV